MRKILVISQGYWPEVFPINTIIKNLSKSDVSIDVLTGYPNYPKGKIFKGYNPFKVTSEKIFNHRIIRVPMISRGVSSKVRIILNYLSFIFSSIIIGSFILRKQKYDVILVYATSPIFQSYIGIFFKFIKKAKLITWAQDLWPNVLKDTGIIKNMFVLKILKYFVKNIYDLNDLILAQSNSFKKDIRKITKTKVSVLYNPGYSEKKIFKPKNSNQLNILYAGNLGNAQPWENLLNFLNSKKLQKIKLTICGEGQKFLFIKNFIKKNKLKNIIIRGFIKNKNLEKKYFENNFLLVMLKPGKDLNKTIPSKFQTYLFYEKPILALSDGEVYNFITKYKLGFVSKPNDIRNYDKMFKKLIKLKKKEYIQISKNIKKFYSNNFSQKTINKKLIQVINDV